MIFPEFIKPGDTIGVTATSGGIVNELKQKRVANATEQLKSKGYNVKLTDNVYKSDSRGCSWILSSLRIIQSGFRDFQIIRDWYIPL